MSNKKALCELTDKFIKGLEKYNLTFDEIKKWKYCGGNMNRHYNYFKICFKNNDLPDKVHECVCGHHIKENCYITDGVEILVLGNCCIKRFVPKNSRTCQVCGEPHKNRVVNRCNDCRKGICDKCDKRCSESYKTCYNCFSN
jgi:hypothetical protein